MNLDAIYELTPQAAERIAAIRLTSVKWSVLDALGARPAIIARTLVARLGLEPNALAAILDEFHSAELIHEPELSRSEYLDRLVPPAESAKPKPNGSEAAARSEPAVAAVTTTERKVSFTLRKSGNRSSKQTTPPVNRAWPIKPLLDFVRERAGGGSLGQLAVYRTFLKVPQDLLEASGLEQLDLESSDLQITDSRLLGALRKGASEVLGIAEEGLPTAG